MKIGSVLFSNLSFHTESYTLPSADALRGHLLGKALKGEVTVVVLSRPLLHWHILLLLLLHGHHHLLLLHAKRLLLLHLHRLLLLLLLLLLLEGRTEWRPRRTAYGGREEVSTYRWCTTTYRGLRTTSSTTKAVLRLHAAAAGAIGRLHAGEAAKRATTAIE